MVALVKIQLYSRLSQSEGREKKLLIATKRFSFTYPRHWFELIVSHSQMIVVSHLCRNKAQSQLPRSHE